MKIVQSFWSKPMLDSNNKLVLAGWRHPKFFMMSWALSCLTFKKYYPEIELVTDEIGYTLLIEKLKLPYSNVRIELDHMNKYPSKLWAIGKLYAYKIQEKPFIHADGDVYIWSKFDKSFENEDLISQQKDIDEGYYTAAIKNAYKYDFSIPDIMKEDLKNNKNIKSCNAGILGGNDLEFINDYSTRAFKFINRNLSKYNCDFNGTYYALLYEQYLFSCLARKKNKTISYFLDYDIKQQDDFLLGDISSFFNKYKKNKRFVHVFSARKKLIKSCYELQNQLELEFPDYFNRINNFYK